METACGHLRTPPDCMRARLAESLPRENLEVLSGGMIDSGGGKVKKFSVDFRVRIAPYPFASF